MVDTPKTRTLAYALSLAAIVAVGCSDDNPATAPIPEDPRKTIVGLVAELKQAYEARDLARYERLFDHSSFLFVFDAVDTRENPRIPESWAWPEERISAHNMFGSTLVERIQVNCVMTLPAPVTEADIGDRPFPEGTMKVVLTDVDLLVDTADPSGGENLIFVVPGDRRGSSFTQTPARSSTVSPSGSSSSGATRNLAPSRPVIAAGGGSRRTISEFDLVGEEPCHENDPKVR